jgi:plastocyanin
VTVTDKILSVSVSPDPITVSPGGTVQFTATVVTTCGSTTSLQEVPVTASAQ